MILAFVFSQQAGLINGNNPDQAELISCELIIMILLSQLISTKNPLFFYKKKYKKNSFVFRFQI
jgi:hypothetical protein